MKKLLSFWRRYEHIVFGLLIWFGPPAFVVVLVALSDPGGVVPCASAVFPIYWLFAFALGEPVEEGPSGLDEEEGYTKCGFCGYRSGDTSICPNCRGFKVVGG